MTRLRAILDRINDIEASLTRIESEAKEHSSRGYQLTVRSLESRRDVLRQELADATREGFVEVCDYRIVPDGPRGYAISAVAGALQNFQELVTIVYDAITDRPKQRASNDAALIEATRFDFGFSYEGSLGIALVIRNDREFFDSKLDRAISSVFDIMKSDTAEKVHDAATKFGRPSVRKLYNWSKIHSEYGLTADIKWVRDGDARFAVLVQPQELAQICRIIESRTEPETEHVKLSGTLASWDTVHRRFIADVPEADPVSGEISENIDVAEKRTVKIRYEFDLLRHTYTDYSLDQERVTWELTGLRELN